MNFFDPDGRDFEIKERRRTITIEATVYTNTKSLESANQAAEFWNNRTSDSYNGKTIIYEINVQPAGDGFLSNQQNHNNCANTYEVNSKKLAEKAPHGEDATGYTNNETGEMYVRDDFATTKPNSEEKSTTGAHEFGHMLGMKHKDKGIMTESQNEYRTNDVLQSNIDEMMNSNEGHRDLISTIFLLFK